MIKISTIAAISTPIGQGGIGIIRISGEKSLEIVRKIFRRKLDFENIPESILKNKADNKLSSETNNNLDNGRDIKEVGCVKNEENTFDEQFKSYTMKHGYIYYNNEVIDEVLVSYFKSPFSYTGEDVCEINCHGGNLVLKRVLEVVLENGAKLAEPGEFTKRAFLNGKMDLSQAEAVMDIINSKSIKESKESIKQLEGFLGKSIKEIKEKIVDLLVDIEANIDYPEYDVEEVQREKINVVLENSILELKKLENSFENGKFLGEGIKTVIVGKPNVGKSSLLNALLKEERAIVTDIAGTTRDTIEENITVNGIPLKIIDTAGIRETTDIVEEIGVEKSKKALDESDLVLMLIDASVDITKEDEKLLDMIKEKNYIILINKIDKDCKIDKDKIIKFIEDSNKNFVGNSVIGNSDKNVVEDATKDKNNIANELNIIEISAKEGIGLEKLENKIEEMFNLSNIDVNNEILITNIRHKNAITESRKKIENVLEANKNSIPIDMLSIDLQNAIQILGEITGETVSEEVINGIFKKFCLGK